MPKTQQVPVSQTMPAFDPQVTPSEYMGKIIEVFRSRPDVLRSNHPTVSFASWGKYAAYITQKHTLEYGLGENSPLARIYNLDGWVLMLGTHYAFHLAEYRAPSATKIMQDSPIIENGQRVWKKYRNIELDSDIFPEIGSEFEQTEQVTVAQVGSATARLFPQRPAIDFATEWFTHKRKPQQGTL